MGKLLMSLKEENEKESNVLNLSSNIRPQLKESGSSMIECAMLIALVAAGCITSIKSLGDTSNKTFQDLTVSMASAGFQPVLPPPP